MAIKILIGGDIVPTDSNKDFFEKGDFQNLLGRDLCDILDDSEFRIFNLEVPLINQPHPIPKDGPNLTSSVESIAGLRAINPCFFGLANNHILDQGQEGLLSTLNLLTDNNIKFAGAGRNLTEASRPYITEIGGVRIGIYCCAEHEYTIASSSAGGANPFDPLESLDHISVLKTQCDYLIVLYHGGKEHYRYPSPNLQKTCRKIVEKGANIVVCQHSHCIGCKEEWQDGTIIYGQGNFLFDHQDNEFWQTGLLLRLSIESGNANIEYIPLVKKQNFVRMAQGDDAEEILRTFSERSEDIKKDGFVEENYREFVLTLQEQYWRILNGRQDILSRALNKFLRKPVSYEKIRRKYTRQNIIGLENFVRCEAHREVLIKIFQIASNNFQ